MNTETPWRDGWEPLDPLRPCYTCGQPPTHYFDRQHNEPAYSGCLHPPVSSDVRPQERWATRATPKEWEKAFSRAAKIIKENKERGWETKFIPRGSTELEMKARGIVAEMVAARLTGLEHDLSFLRKGYRRSKKKADIGQNVEVRNTRDHRGPLMLYDNDPPDRLALLVTGVDPFVLRGWIRVKHGKVKRFYRVRPSPSRWHVPQSLLHPMPLPDSA